MTTTARPREELPEITSDMVDRMPPHDLMAETGALGCMLIDPETVGPCMMFLKSAEAFFKEEHQIIAAAMFDLHEKNVPVDHLTVYSYLLDHKNIEGVGGIDYLKELVKAVPSSWSAERYAATVAECWDRRRAIGACTANLKDLYDGGAPAGEIIDRCESRMFEVAQRTAFGVEVRLVDALHDALGAMDRKSVDGSSGLASGFIELDNLTDGMHKAEMIVLAARPSVGKTALATNIAEHVGVRLQLPVGMISMEMTTQQLGQRMLCARSGVDSHKLRRGMLNARERDLLAEAARDLSSAPIFINDIPNQSLTAVRAAGRRMVRKDDIRLLIIDYLQLMQPSKKCENRQQEITHISMGIKALARELNIPILILSQLNRASESENRMPRTSDLRESGAIEQDADTVMLLHREAVAHRGDEEWAYAHVQDLNLATLIVGKQRNGPCGALKLTFLDQSARFANYNPGV